MYDMYRWNQAAGPRENAAPASAPARRGRLTRPVRRPGEAVRALQVALDRRDNGGASDAPGDR